jgi:hypothetical protein
MQRAKADWSSKWLTIPKFKARLLLALLRPPKVKRLVGVVRAVGAAQAAVVVMVDAVAVMATGVVVTTSVAKAAKTAAKN